MNKEELLKEHYVLLSCFDGKCHYEETRNLVNYIEQLQQENEQLKHNWYSLKMYLKEKAKPFSDFDNYDVERIINKMEELEILKGGDSNENNNK